MGQAGVSPAVFDSTGKMPVGPAAKMAVPLLTNDFILFSFGFAGQIARHASPLSREDQSFAENLRSA